MTSSPNLSGSTALLPDVLLNPTNKALKDRCALLENEIQNKAHNVETFQQQLVVDSARLNSVQKTVGTVQKRLVELKESSNSVQSSVSILNTEISKYVSDMATMRQNMTELLSRLSRRSALTKDQTDSRSYDQPDVDRWTQQCAVLMSGQRSAARQRLQKAEERTTELAREIALWITENKSAATAISDAEAILNFRTNQGRTELEKVRASADGVRNLLDKEAQHHAEVQQQLTNIWRQKGAWIAELQDLQSKLDLSAERSDFLEQSKRIVEEETAEAKKCLARKQVKLEQAKAESSGVDRLVTEASSAINLIHLHIQSANVKRADTQQLLESIQSKCARKELELAIGQRTHTDFQRQLINAQNLFQLLKQKHVARQEFLNDVVAAASEAAECTSDARDINRSVELLFMTLSKEKKVQEDALIECQHLISQVFTERMQIADNYEKYSADIKFLRSSLQHADALYKTKEIEAAKATHVIEQMIETIESKTEKLYIEKKKAEGLDKASLAAANHEHTLLQERYKKIDEQVKIGRIAVSSATSELSKHKRWCETSLLREYKLIKEYYSEIYGEVEGLERELRPMISGIEKEVVIQSAVGLDEADPSQQMEVELKITQALYNSISVANATEQRLKQAAIAAEKREKLRAEAEDAIKARQNALNQEMEAFSSMVEAFSCDVRSLEQERLVLALQCHARQEELKFLAARNKDALQQITRRVNHEVQNTAAISMANAAAKRLEACTNQSHCSDGITIGPIANVGVLAMALRKETNNHRDHISESSVLDVDAVAEMSPEELQARLISLRTAERDQLYNRGDYLDAAIVAAEKELRNAEKAIFLLRMCASESCTDVSVVNSAQQLSSTSARTYRPNDEFTDTLSVRVGHLEDDASTNRELSEQILAEEDRLSQLSDIFESAKRAHSAVQQQYSEVETQHKKSVILLRRLSSRLDRAARVRDPISSEKKGNDMTIGNAFLPALLHDLKHGWVCGKYARQIHMNDQHTDEADILYDNMTKIAAHYDEIQSDIDRVVKKYSDVSADISLVEAWAHIQKLYGLDQLSPLSRNHPALPNSVSAAECSESGSNDSNKDDADNVHENASTADRKKLKNTSAFPGRPATRALVNALLIKGHSVQAMHGKL